MRIGEEYDYEKDNADFTVDWKSSPDDVMKYVDAVLKQHGLEIVVHPTDSDEFAYSIVPIVPIVK